MTIVFTNVPEFAGTTGTGANSFSITVHRARSGGHRHDEKRHRDDGDGRFSIAYGDLTATDGLAGYSTGRLSVTGEEGEPEQVSAAFITVNFLQVMGARVVRGRGSESS